MANLLKIIFFFRTDGRTDEQTDKRTNGRTDGRTVRLYYAPNFIWGHKNITILESIEVNVTPLIWNYESMFM